MRLFGTGIIALLFSLAISQQVFAHQLNPAVIEALTGEKIEYASHHDVEQEDASVADPRDQSRTFYSFPEWYIVYSAQEYADFVAAGNRPSQFLYFTAIGQMWDSWEYSEIAAGSPPDATTNTVLWTIAVSFTIEYGLIGLYENTIGWLSEWLHFGYKTKEDTYTDRVAMDYGLFLNQTPWYDFSYKGAMSGLWKTYGWSSISPRGIERRIVYTVGYAVKAVYAGGIRALSDATFEGGAGLMTEVETTNELLSLPRYRAFKDPVMQLALDGVNFKTIQGHSQIAMSLVTPEMFDCKELIKYEIFSMPLVTDQLTVRRMLSVPVADLAEVLRSSKACGISVEHIYDY
jgi:hypothetical protein